MMQNFRQSSNAFGKSGYFCLKLKTLTRFDVNGYKRVLGILFILFRSWFTKIEKALVSTRSYIQGFKIFI